MIGDALFDCGESLDHYLTNFEWPAEVADRIQRLREQIRDAQEWIDAGRFEFLGNVRLAGSIAQTPPRGHTTSCFDADHSSLRRRAARND
jgi:hypothetical protein